MSPEITKKKDYILIVPKAGTDYSEILRAVGRLFYVDEIPEKNRIWVFREGPEKFSCDDLLKLRDIIKENYPNDHKINKTAILEAIDDKLGIVKHREKKIRQLSGWLTHEEAEELKTSLNVFDQINEGDWP